MEKRNNKGQFRKGPIEDALTRAKRLESLKVAAKKKDTYLGELKRPPFIIFGEVSNLLKKEKNWEL